MERFRIEQSVAQAIVHTRSANNVSILNNQIVGLANAPRGIDVGYASANSNGVVIDGNTFEDVYCGVYINQATNLNILSNTFNADMGDGGIVFDGTWPFSNITVNNNTANDIDYLMFLFGSWGSVNYTGNTLNNSELINAGVRNVNKSIPYLLIQPAIAGADNGDDITIRTGTYAGNVDATSKEVTLIPGNSPGCVTINGNLTLNDMNTLEMEVDGTTACTLYDQVSVIGTVTLNGATLSLDLNYVPTLGDSCILISNDGTDPVTGLFAQGYSIDVSGELFRINYAGGDGNDVVLTKCGGGVVNTTINKEFCTIQDAIDDPATLDNHVITVAAGTYAEQLFVYKKVDLRGPNYGVSANSPRNPEAIIVPPSNLINMALPKPEQDNGAYLVVFYNDKNGIKMDGFKISGDNTNINGFTYAGMNIEATYGVWSAGLDSIEFKNNIVENFTFMGFIAGNSFGNSSSNLTLSNNKINNIHDLNASGYGFGAYIQATGGSITNNVITNVRNGIQVQPYTAPAGGTVSNNTFTAYGLGMYYNYAENNNGAWTMENNSITGVSAPGSLGGQIIWSGVAVQTMNNNAGPVTIQQNAINGGPLTAPSTNYTDVIGYRVRTPNNNAVDINSFTGNSIMNVEKLIDNATTQTVNATCNWYDETSANIISGLMSGNVNFIPYLIPDFAGSTYNWSGMDTYACNGTPVEITSTSSTPNQYCQNDGTITVNYSGGSENYTVAWSGASSGSTSGIMGTTYTITGLPNGNYTIVVTDANGSTDSEMASVGNLPVRNTTTTTYHATVQAAIDAAATGNVIEICSNLTEGLITINKSIELDGNGFTITSTSATWGIGLEAQNIYIHDIGITGTGTQGIQQGCDAHNLVMTNVTANNCGGTGISIYGSDNCILTNITSTNNNGNGLNITNCDNTTINGITTSGNMFTGGFNAGIGIFTSDVYCLPAGINGLALNGTVSIAEDTKVYSQKGNASHVITGLTGPDLTWAVGIGALDRYYWSSKSTAYAVVDALFEAPFNLPNTSVYVVNVPTEVFYVEDNPNGDNTPPMLIQTAINLQASGGTIQVEPGTYNENVAVNKSLTLLGANANIACGSRTGESLIAPSSGLPFNVTADNVTINGFEITAPTHQYAINGGGTSGLNIRYNDIHNVGNTVSGVNVHAIVYIQPNSSTSNVTISDNCLEDISSTSLTEYSAAAIGVLQSTSAGVLTGLNIERNIINDVHVNAGNWPTGKIAYGIILNVGGNSSYMTNTGKIVDAVINQNEISNLSGHIATAIGMEGNTEDASVTNNLILNLSGTKTGGTRAAGGYDLSGIKFENNKFVSTITVNNNSIATNTFTHSAGSGIGYGVSNYVPQANGGTLALGCNWYGTSIYNEIEDNPTFTGRIFNKDNCTTNFTPYLSSDGDGPGIGFQPTGSCNGTPVVIASAVPTDRIFCVDGSIVVTFSGGVAPYDIEWTGGSASGVTSPYTITNLAGGLYGITVTDDNESFATTSATVLNLPVRNTTDNLHYATIQAAINAATTTNGEILEVCAGTYAEDVVVTKSLDIRGPKYGVAGNGGGRGTGEAIVVPATSQSDAVFMIRTNDVSINGFTINGNNSAINTGWTGTNGADIDAFDGVGIYDPANAISVSGAKIENNIIENLAYFGVDNFGWYNYGNPATSGHLVKNNLFRNLGTYGTGSGYDFWGGGVLIYNNNYTRIEGNVMTNVRIGVQTGNFSSANPGIADYQVITNNNIQARRRGIFHNLAYSNASPLTLSNNSVTGLANANETVWDGILLASLSVPASATGNTINGTGISNPSEGIEVWNVNNTSPSVISGGSISNVNTGIFLNNYEGYNSDGTDGAHATISGLTITPNANGIGIRLLDSPSSTAHARVNASVTGVTITGGAEGIKLEQTNAAGAAVGGSFTNNIISAGAAGINVARSALSGTNALTISGNTINHANQMFGGNPAVGISLTNITGTAAATVSNNNISGPLYGYVGYNINTTPSTGISGGTVSGVMQGLALVNTIGGPLASSTLSMSGTTMSGFTGTSANPANNFHAGVYTFTAAPTTPVTGINLTVNNVTIDGTGVPSQASGGIYLADFSTGGVTVQTINVTTSNIINNANRGVDARGRVNLTLTGNTISNNGHTAFGSGGNDGFSVIAQQNAQITATNNFITLPATSTTQAFGLMTGNGTTNLITASSNSILFNGNNFAGSKSAKSDPGTGSINAACNWWGNICPADVVSGNVMIYPFLVDGTDAGGNPVDGFQPSVLCNEPLLSISINGPSGPAINITSGNSDDLTVCSGEEVDFNPVAVVNLPAANCSSLRVQKAVTSAIPNIASSTTDLPYSTASMPPAITETPVNNTLTSKSATFVYTPYYDVNGNNQYDAGTDVAGGLITFTLTVEPVPSISNTVTSGAYSQVMTSGGSYAHAICHNTNITTSIPTLNSTLANACGTLRIQTQYISTLPNIPSATLDVTFTQAQMAGAQTISPENNTGMTQTITFITTPYYDVNNNGSFEPAVDIEGDVTTFVLTVHPIPSGAISGTAFVIQNAPTTANVTFTGSVGTAPYTFTYNVNGGGTQTISTIGMNDAITLPHPNGTPGVFTYTLLSVTDANGCAGVVDPLQDTVVITVIASNMLPDLAPSIARPLNGSFVNGQLKEGYVQFSNGGNGPTFGVTKVRLPKTVSNFNLVINQSATMSAGQSVVNNLCTFADLGFAWEITYPTPIAVGTNIKIGYSLTATGFTGSDGTITATILNGTGGDSNNFNNKATRRFVIN